MIHKTITPDKREVNVSFTVPENYIGEEIEIIAFIKNKGFSTAAPGAPLTSEDFSTWIEQAEKAPSVTLEEAKNKWKNQKEKLQQLIK